MADDLGRDGMKNQVKGAAKEVAGKVRKNVGDLTDNHSEEFKGAAKELEGKDFSASNAKLNQDQIGSVLVNKWHINPPDKNCAGCHR